MIGKIVSFHCICVDLFPLSFKKFSNSVWFKNLLVILKKYVSEKGKK